MPMTLLYKRQVGPTPGGSDEWPNATNTGHTHWPGFTGLTAFGGSDPLTPAQNGSTYEGIAFEGLTIGTAANPVANITFRGCRFRSSWTDGWNIQVHGTNIRFEYCTIEPFSSQAIPVTADHSYQLGIDIRGASSVTAEYCNIYGFGNAFQIEQSSLSLPVVVQHCWIHDAADQAEELASPYHHDGFLSNNGGPQYVVLHHNTISSGGNTNAIALQSTGASYSNITITENWLAGFGYTVNIGDGFSSGNTNIVFEDNVLSTEIDSVYGPFKNSWPGTSAGCSWRRNIWRVPAGAPVGSAADDGKFWMPVGGVVNLSSPGSAVSTTDYTG